MQSTTDGRVSGTMILVYTSGMMFILRHFAGPIAHRLSPVGMLCGSSALAGIGLYLLSTANSPATAFGFATIFGLGIAFFWPTMLGVTAERFPKGGALALALMGSVGNLAISQVLPAMGKIVDHYAVAQVESAAPEYAKEVLKFNEAGQAVTLNKDEMKALEKTVKTAKEQEQPVNEQDVAALSAAKSAESTGFSMAFRWVSVLPIALVIIFGAIALYDKAQGGYKPELLMSREENELYAGGVQAALE
jgi:hypothetical protein